MATFVETSESVLRQPLTLLEHIQRGETLRTLPAQLATLALAGFGAFGFLIGLSRSPLWGLLAAPKLMLVALGTAALCLPALVVYGRLLGHTASALQVVCQLLLALATSGLTLVALAPVWLVYVQLFGEPPHGYFRVMMGCILFLSVAGLRGAWVLVRGLRAQGRPRAPLVAWTLLYGLVGLQAAWVLRPFVGTPEDAATSRGVVLLRPLERSALDASGQLVGSNVRVLTDAPPAQQQPQQQPQQQELKPWAP